MSLLMRLFSLFFLHYDAGDTTNQICFTFLCSSGTGQVCKEGHEGP